MVTLMRKGLNKGRLYLSKDPLTGLPNRQDTFFETSFEASLHEGGTERMDSRDVYQEKMDAQLRQWDAQIAELRAKADKAKAQAKIEYLERVEEIRSKRDTAARKLEELKKTSDDAWADVKNGLEKAWKDLGSAIDSAFSRFKPS
jgi:uncharacterized coiled-coil DUF342 family protein